MRPEKETLCAQESPTIHDLPGILLSNKQHWKEAFRSDCSKVAAFMNVTNVGIGFSVCSWS